MILSARVAEEGGGNLWPWYWCIDTRDALALCWGAPSGIEPENGDTLLIITLKIGLEVGKNFGSDLMTPTSETLLD